MILSPYDDYVRQSPDLTISDVVRETNRATYLRSLTLAEHADWIGAIMAELTCRGVQAAAPLAEAQGRVVAAAEARR